MREALNVSRRELLKTGGALFVAFSLPLDAAQADAPPLAQKPLALDQVDTFLSIDAKGAVTVFSGKVDLGTGVRTALQQIAADELDVPLSALSIIVGDTDLTPDEGPTYGSLSIQLAGTAIRQAAATARDALLDMAAQQLGAPKADLQVHDGNVSAPGGAHTSYGALIGGKSFALKLNPNVSPKDPAKHLFVGKPIARADIPEKLTGRFTYMHDFRVPGMLYGSVIRPPALGATLLSVDESSIAHIPGIVKVVRDKDFLGVVTASEWAAVRAARELKTQWSKSETLPTSDKLWEHVRATKIIGNDVTSNVGNTQTALAAANKKLAATYDFAIHTHGSIGPSCAICEFKDGKLTCWSASQATHNLRKQLALMLSMPLESVHCLYVDGAGCYGRNGHEDAAADSALLAKAVGKPVRVQWSRADEHGWDPKGAPTLIDMRAGIDASGAVTAWEGDFFIPQGAGKDVDLVAVILAEKPKENLISPGGIVGDSAIPYKFPNVATICHRLETTPLRPSWIRSPGRMQNTYANECFIDEIAAEIGADPLEFRIKHLDPADKRGLELLERLRHVASWQPRKLPRDKAPEGVILKGRGLTYIKYELVRTYVGIVVDVEVEVDSALADIRVTKVYVVHDCGQIINPLGVRAQIEGSVIQTLSRVMKEEVVFDRSMVTTLDWASYPILRFPEVPELVIDMIDRPQEKPWGAGEPSAAVVPSAISNAIFDASGVRLRSVPFKREKMKAALQARLKAVKQVQDQ